ncbi:hypothetical protein GTP58_06510 [Duganella sp. CY15W]|uniref:hypothetical protein n=1 Tax=Duganella sp. CY15W TaxID=2692172 RepID=UPI00136EB6DD|nr:hypothetical protein [Duganella sp. CY15W]MYM27968.1 hypothetical protein [Duganella sp. CY15W]
MALVVWWLCPFPAGRGLPLIRPRNLPGIRVGAIGLLAIANERPEVLPLRARIYPHLIDGILPARAYISRDGDHQTRFAYNNAGEVMVRLVMWRRTLNTVEQQILPNDFTPKLINPYIYALHPMHVSRHRQQLQLGSGRSVDGVYGGRSRREWHRYRIL